MSNTLAEAAATAPLKVGRIRWTGFETIVYREYQRIIRIWTQTILPSAVTQVLYFAIFGSLLGSRIGAMGGFGYMEYMAPGLIMMAINVNSYSNVVSSFYGAKFGKHVEELLVSPLPSWLIVCGYMTGGLVRGALVGIAVTAVTLVFTHLHVQHPVIVAGAALLSSIIFSLGGFLNALFAKNFDQVNIIPTFVLTPLYWFGGIFYSVSLLPRWAHAISYFNPILYMVDAFRYGFLGVADVRMIVSFAIMIGATVLLFVAAIAYMERGAGIRE